MPSRVVVSSHRPIPCRPNLGHLELFYHVVRNRGISNAIGRMRRNIQQPALSEQMKLLEEAVGGKLFERQPFRLTAEGQELYRTVQPLFDNLDHTVTRLQNRRRSHLRVAGEELMIQQYVGPVMQTILRLEPQTRITCSAGNGVEMVRWLREGEVDVVIAALNGERPPGLACQHITTRPLVLVVRKRTSIRSADHFWTQPEIIAPLICPCSTDGISQVFQRGLKRGSVSWWPQIVTSSAGTVAPYVASGAGVGVTLDMPHLVGHPQVRTLRLDGFDPVQISALWRPEDTLRLKPLLATIEQCVPAE